MNNNPLIKNEEDIKSIDSLIEEVFSHKKNISLPSQENFQKEPKKLNDETDFKKRKLHVKLLPHDQI